MGNPVNYTDPSGMRCAQLNCLSNNYSPSLPVSDGLAVSLMPLAESGCLGFDFPFFAPPKRGYVEGYSFAQGIGKGEIGGFETVYDFATMTRAKFIYYGTIGLAPSGASGSIYAGDISGFGWDNDFESRQIIGDYSGPFEGFYFGVGTPVAHLGVGVGQFHDPSWKIRGHFNYYSIGFSLLPGEVVSFRTIYRYEENSIEFYADKFGNVNKDKLISDILTGRESPIGLGILPTLALPGISNRRASQIGKISIEVMKFELYWKLHHIFSN